MICSLNEDYIKKLYIYHLHGDVFHANNDFYYTSDIYFFYQYSTFEGTFRRSQI
jgi:hypothetical protein